MFKPLKILDEKHKILRQKSKEVQLPLSKEDKKTIDQIIKHLTYSQIEKYAEKYDLRPGMGLAFPQLGELKRIIVIVHEYEDEKFRNYVIVNPKIISHSEEKVALETGEGCLSVNREVEGHVPRYARVTITGYDPDGEKITIRAREDLSVAFQHEVDHLDGILFTDKIDLFELCKRMGIKRDAWYTIRILHHHFLFSTISWNFFNAFITCCSNRIAIFVTAVKFTTVNIAGVNLTSKQYKNNIRQKR